MKKAIRSPFFYVGDKYKLVEQLKNYFPKSIKTYVEPFCGGGSSFLNVSAHKYYLNDIDKYIIKLHNFFCEYAEKQRDLVAELEKIIRYYDLSCSYRNITVPESLKKTYIKTYYARYNKNSFIRMREDFNKDKSNLHLLYLLLIYGFNHFLRFNVSGDFNLPVGNVDFNKNVVSALQNYLQFVRGKDIHFSSLDFNDFISNISLDEECFVYCDPPYLISDSEYNKLWHKEDELKLLNLLDNLNARHIKFALSNVFTHKGRTNDILIEWAEKYTVVPVHSNYISYHDNTIKSDLKEVLIINYEKV